MKANEFTQVRVEQKGVDVALKLIDVNGKALATMDSPNSKQGPETLSFIAEKSGSFVFQVSLLDAKAEKGSYTINRKVARTATGKDKRRVEVERLFVEGITARDTEGQAETGIAKLDGAVRVKNRGVKLTEEQERGSVADESTQLLMSEFYRLHQANPHLTKAAALQLAQLEMIEGKLQPLTAGQKRDTGQIPGSQLHGLTYAYDLNKPYAHPYYWSPFILIGNWR